MPRKKKAGSENIDPLESATKQNHLPSRRKNASQRRVSFPKTPSQKSLTQMRYVIGLPSSEDKERLQLEDIEEWEEKQRTPLTAGDTARLRSKTSDQRKANGRKRKHEIADTDDDKDIHENKDERVLSKKKRVKLAEEVGDSEDEEWEGISKRRSSRISRKSTREKSLKSKSSSKTANPKFMTEEKRNEYHRLTQMVVNGRPFVSSENLALLEDIPEQTPPESAQNSSILKSKQKKASVLPLEHDLLNKSAVRAASLELDDDFLTTLPKGKQPTSPVLGTENLGPLAGEQPPFTPKKVRRLEIPSSQSPAITPLSIRSVRIPQSKNRSPLQQRCVNDLQMELSPIKKKRSVRFSLERDPYSKISPRRIRNKQNKNSPKRPLCLHRPLLSNTTIKDSYSDTEDESVDDFEAIDDLSAREIIELDNTARPLSQNLAQRQERAIELCATNEESLKSNAIESFSRLDSSCVENHERLGINTDQFERSETAAKIASASKQADTAVTSPRNKHELDEASQADSASVQLLNDIFEYSQRNSREVQACQSASQESVERFSIQLNSAANRQEMAHARSQVSVIDLSQTSSHQSHVETPTLRLGSPPRLLSSQLPSIPPNALSPIRPSTVTTLVPSTPASNRYVQVPSSPPPQLPSSSLLTTSEQTQSTLSKRLLSVSQLLPESLLQYEIPALLGSTQPEVDE